MFQMFFSTCSVGREESKVLAIVATAGQGEMPKSAVKFWQDVTGSLRVLSWGYCGSDHPFF